MVRAGDEKEESELCLGLKRRLGVNCSGNRKIHGTPMKAAALTPFPAMQT